MNINTVSLPGIFMMCEWNINDNKHYLLSSYFVPYSLYALV